MSADSGCFRIDRIADARTLAEQSGLEIDDFLETNGFWASEDHHWSRDDDRDAAIVWGSSVEALLRDRGTDVLTAGEDLTKTYLELRTHLRDTHSSMGSYEAIIRRIEDLVDLNQHLMETSTLRDRLESKNKGMHRRIRLFGHRQPSMSSPSELDGFDLPTGPAR